MLDPNSGKKELKRTRDTRFSLAVKTWRETCSITGNVIKAAAIREEEQEFIFTRQLSGW